MGTTVVCAVLFGTFFGVLSMSMSKALRYEAPDQCKWVVKNNDGADEDVTLVCRVRTINSELPALQPQHTVRLRLECSDTLFFQSSLLTGSFQQLVELREFSIEYCKIGNLSEGAFRGLKELRNLTVNTHNTDWSAMTLEISPNAFTDEMRLLERLDLGQNNMWNLPEGVLCPLYSLEVLNLTHNRLRGVSSFKFTQHSMERCGGNLRILDLSNNNIDRLPPGQFSGLARLQKLYLHGNGLTHLADRTFEGLRTLNILKLSDNRLKSLPLELFSDNLEIKEMYLRNNSINVLAPGLFRNMSQLLVLDLSHNELTEDWINAMTFAKLVRLIVLDASYNRISKLEQSMFSELFNLQYLRLNDNFLEAIPDFIFAELSNLHTLILSNNKLSRIDGNTLNGLFALQSLSLDNNRIFSIHPEALSNCSDLQELHLNGNKLVEVPDVLLNVPMLKDLDLGENHIDTLTSNTFRDMKELYGLRLTENYIGNITKGVFGKMTNLKLLNLSRNKIQKIEPGSFDLNKNLRAIRLDGNYLMDIDDLFGKLPQLLWLNISENQLRKLNYEQIPVNLQWLDVHANQIEQLSNYFEIKSSLSLTTFDISANKLTEISSSDIPTSIEILYLNDNLISRVVAYAFYDKPNLTRVDLFGNKITILDPLSLRISDVPQDKPIPEFHLGGNPYKCDCTMDWLQKFNTENRSRNKPKLVDLESIYCQLLYNRGKTYVPLVEATPYQFLCSYESHCFQTCHCCDFDACDCEMTCPRNCTCYRDESWSANVVDCSARGYVEKLPEQVPMDATQLYLDGNDLRLMRSHALIGRKRLKILFLNNSNIEHIENRTFNGLRNLEELHLDENRLMELRGYEFEGLESLREIHLQRNRLTIINNNTFTSLSWLRVLYLDHNRLITYDVWKLPLTLNKVSLAFNPWTCECEYTEKLREWMIKGDTVFDLKNVRCLYNVTDMDFYSETLYNDNPEMGFYIASENETSCTGAANIDNSINGNLTATKTVLKQQAIQDYMVLLGITLVVFAVILTTILFLFIFRQEVRVWFHSKFGVRLFHNSNDMDRDDKLFDAFISYSSKDEAWVAEVLAPALEPNYKLCLHYRDFPVGAFLADTIVQAVESSRRTIMILSENFIKSEWCRFEFKSAHHQVLRDRRRRLIVVLLGEVPQKDLDPDIRLYLKTNVYLQWGDKLFWEKLKFALPDVPSNHRRRGSSRGPHVHHHVHRHGGGARGQSGTGGGGNAGAGGGGGGGGTQRTVAIHI